MLTVAAFVCGAISGHVSAAAPAVVSIPCRDHLVSFEISLAGGAPVRVDCDRTAPVRIDPLNPDFALDAGGMDLIITTAAPRLRFKSTGRPMELVVPDGIYDSSLKSACSGATSCEGTIGGGFRATLKRIRHMLLTPSQAPFPTPLILRVESALHPAIWSFSSPSLRYLSDTPPLEFVGDSAWLEEVVTRKGSSVFLVVRPSDLIYTLTLEVQPFWRAAFIASDAWTCNDDRSSCSMSPPVAETGVNLDVPSRLVECGAEATSVRIPPGFTLSVGFHLPARGISFWLLCTEDGWAAPPFVTDPNPPEWEMHARIYHSNRHVFGVSHDVVQTGPGKTGIRDVMITTGPRMAYSLEGAVCSAWGRCTYNIDHSVPFRVTFGALDGVFSAAEFICGEDGVFSYTITATLKDANASAAAVVTCTLGMASTAASWMYTFESSGSVHVNPSALAHGTVTFQGCDGDVVGLPNNGDLPTGGCEGVCTCDITVQPTTRRTFGLLRNVQVSCRTSSVSYLFEVVLYRSTPNERAVWISCGAEGVVSFVNMTDPLIKLVNTSTVPGVGKVLVAKVGGLSVADVSVTERVDLAIEDLHVSYLPRVDDDSGTSGGGEPVMGGGGISGPDLGGPMVVADPTAPARTFPGTPPVEAPILAPLSVPVAERSPTVGGHRTVTPTAAPALASAPGPISIGTEGAADTPLTPGLAIPVVVAKSTATRTGVPSGDFTIASIADELVMLVDGKSGGEEGGARLLDDPRVLGKLTELLWAADEAQAGSDDSVLQRVSRRLDAMGVNVGVGGGGCSARCSEEGGVGASGSGNPSVTLTPVLFHVVCLACASGVDGGGWSARRQASSGRPVVLCEGAAAESQRACFEAAVCAGYDAVSGARGGVCVIAGSEEPCPVCSRASTTGADSPSSLWALGVVAVGCAAAACSVVAAGVVMYTRWLRAARSRTGPSGASGVKELEAGSMSTAGSDARGGGGAVEVGVTVEDASFPASKGALVVEVLSPTDGSAIPVGASSSSVAVAVRDGNGAVPVDECVGVDTPNDVVSNITAAPVAATIGESDVLF